MDGESIYSIVSVNLFKALDELLLAIDFGIPPSSWLTLHRFRTNLFGVSCSLCSALRFALISAYRFWLRCVANFGTSFLANKLLALGGQLLGLLLQHTVDGLGDLQEDIVHVALGIDLFKETRQISVEMSIPKDSPSGSFRYTVPGCRWC